jgi:hypothetical protein
MSGESNATNSARADRLNEMKMECGCGACSWAGDSRGGERRACAPPGETEGAMLDDEARIERAQDGLERALCGTGDVAVVRRILLEYCKLEDMLRAGCGPVAELETALANSWALSEGHADLVFEADRNAGKRWWCFLPLDNGYGYGTEKDAKRYAEARGLSIAYQLPCLAQPDIEADGFDIAERLRVDETELVRPECAHGGEREPKRMTCRSCGDRVNAGRFWRLTCGGPVCAACAEAGRLPECQCGECDGIECDGPPDDTHGGSGNRTRGD